ncbi:MAG: crossover junction endodeoxyribonuclease RuvC [Coriobacteriia bacterium]|nr:crossover junction endodeoxyribonuclease RuvC [Coriobacteriia bacterium]
MFDSSLSAGGVRVIVLGIDPGLANTGWGIVEVNGSYLRCLAYGCITTPASDQLSGRLSAIHRELVSIIARYAPVECGIESVYFGTNAKTAFATGQARGVAVLATADAGLVLGEYGPGEIKMAVVGAGSADKSQVQYMVRVLLGLAEEPQPHHAADALAAAICHAHMRVGRSLAEATR